MKLGDIARLVNGELHGDPDLEIRGVASLDRARAGDLSFLANPKYRHLLEKTQASALLLPRGDWKLSAAAILCDNPYYAFALVMRQFYRLVHRLAPGIHPTAVIDPDARVGENVAIRAYVVVESGVEIGDGTQIFPHCYIGQNTRIGSETTIYPGVMIREECEIGNRVIVQPGAVIGSDGFGFAPEKGRYHKIPQSGRVVIEDDVEIGANTCVDRATLGETRIRRGAKLDNLIQVAHNVEIGEDTVIAGQAGISGSSKIGHHAMIGGQAGISGHLKLGNYVIVGAQAGVTKDVPDGTFVSGYPARPHKESLRVEAAQMKLPELLKKIRQLEQKIAALEKRLEESA